ncbi:MAG: hypothetical protein JW918_19080 [Anaerolineae bacterium]|nr:hypothetical protein [Anaerolineae bacterium]
MDRRRRSSLATGLVLILVGALIFATQLVPGWEMWFQWPLFIVGIGAVLLVIGLLTRVPAMAVPACIVAGIGGLLYYQNVTGDWNSWAYAWALIPGFLGVGIILAGLLGGRFRKPLREGGQLILISLVLFLAFGSFLGLIGLGPLGQYWPVLLIALGALILFNRLIFRRR